MKKHVITSLVLAACSMVLAQPVHAQTPAAPASQTLSVEEASREMESYVSQARQLVAILQGINSKETADAAAPEVEVLRKELRWITTYMKEHASRAELVDFLVMKFPEALELETQIVQLDLILASAKPAWYGSDALRSCYMEGKADDSDVIIAERPEGMDPVITVEEAKFYGALVDEMVAILVDIKDILASAKDKASADAAAEKIQACYVRGQMLTAIAKDGCKNNPAVADFLAEKSKAGEPVMLEVLELIGKLSEVDFHGSEALKGIFVKH